MVCATVIGPSIASHPEHPPFTVGPRYSDKRFFCYFLRNNTTTTTLHLLLTTTTTTTTTCIVYTLPVYIRLVSSGINLISLSAFDPADITTYVYVYAYTLYTRTRENSVKKKYPTWYIIILTIIIIIKRYNIIIEPVATPPLFETHAGARAHTFDRLPIICIIIIHIFGYQFGLCTT